MLDRLARVFVLTVCCQAMWTGCATAAPLGRVPYEPSQAGIVEFQEAYDRFLAMQSAAKVAASALPAYVDAGIVLSNTSCQIWLTQLAKADRDTGLAKDLMNVIGNLIIGIAGINGANPGSLARGALGLAAGNAAIDTYRADILLGSIVDIETKMIEDRKVAQVALKSLPLTTFDMAKDSLLDYHRLCSVSRITLLLKTSLAAVRFEKPDTGLVTATENALANTAIAAFQRDVGEPSGTLFNRDILYQLYLAALAFPGPVDPAMPAFVKEAKTQAYVDGLVAKINASANKTALLTGLQNLANLLKFADRLKADSDKAAKVVALQRIFAADSFRDAARDQALQSLGALKDAAPDLTADVLQPTNAASVSTILIDRPSELITRLENQAETSNGKKLRAARVGMLDATVNDIRRYQAATQQAEAARRLINLLSSDTQTTFSVTPRIVIGDK